MFKKELTRRFGKMASGISGYCDHLNFRSLEDFEDEAFAYLMKNVKGVKMLDLNETDITSESIKLLTRLEYVNEIRAKDCRYLDNACISSLNQLNELVFLHVKDTLITIDGLLQLSQLQNLKKLMFSAADVASIKGKLIQLKTMMPQCEITINSKPYGCNTIDLFIYGIKEKPFTYRLKIKNEPLVEDWSKWLIQPVDIYIEAAAQGPYAVDAIEWIEINPIETRVDGKLAPAIVVDHTAEIVKVLEWLSFPYMITDGNINLYLLQKEI